MFNPVMIKIKSNFSKIISYPYCSKTSIFASNFAIPIILPLFLCITITVLLGCSFISQKVSEVVENPTPPAIVTEVIQPSDAKEANENAEIPTSKQQDEASSDIVYDTKFPLPANIQNFQKISTGEEGITFMTNMTIDEVIDFYREKFISQGLSEDSLLTSINEDNFSLVFRGKGMPIILQGVSFGEGMTSISLRREDT